MFNRQVQTIYEKTISKYFLEESIFFIIMLIIIQEIFLTYEKSIAGSEGICFLNTFLAFPPSTNDGGDSEDCQHQQADHGSNVDSGLV